MESQRGWRPWLRMRLSIWQECAAKKIHGPPGKDGRYSTFQSKEPSRRLPWIIRRMVLPLSAGSSGHIFQLNGLGDWERLYNGSGDIY